MTAASFFWIGVLAFLLLTLASVGATAIYHVVWHDLKEFCIKRDRRDVFDAIHDDHDDVALGLETVRSLAIALLSVAIGGWCLMSDPATFENQTWQIIARIVALLFGIVLATVWLPNAVAQWGKVAIYYFWPIFRVASYVMLPLSLGAIAVEKAIRRMANDEEEQTEEEAFEEEVLAIVTEGMHDGHLQDDAREMIEGVIELGDVDVADIMTVRSKMDTISVDCSWPEILEMVVACGRTRIPVHGKTQDDIVGILYVKDLLAELARSGNKSEPEKSLIEITRKPWYVGPTRKLDDMLQQFRKKREHLAIVREEFERVAGLVTIEDVLEEIVGEIVDETDKEQIEEIQRLDEHTAIIQGRTHLADINETLGLELPEPEDFDTIAGFVVSHLGRIPRTGEAFEVPNDKIRITVIEANKRKVERVRIESTNGKLREEDPVDNTER